MVGKLRLRINTLSPGLQYESDLPMLADRKEGGAHTATMSLQAKVVPSANDSMKLSALAIPGIVGPGRIQKNCGVML